LPVGLLALWPVLAFGQTVVVGRVAVGGDPVVGAEITLTPHDVTVTSGADGRYHFVVPAAGQATISVRAVGFQPTSRRFIFSGRDSMVVNFSLVRTAQVLDSVSVVGTAAASPGRLQAFEERRATGMGQYFTRADLEGHGSAPLSRVFRAAKNLQLFRRPAACGGGFTVGTGRGQDRLVIPPGERLGCSGNPFACFPAIYLDGMAFWTPGTTEPPDVDLFRSEEFEAIEIYRGPASVPPELNALGSSCGVIALWTRAGGRG
jgi:hypothetical protein